MSLVSKQDRIRLRSELYVNGEIDLDQFYSLEKEALEEEELENKESKYEGLSLTELDELKRSEEADLSPSDAPIVSTVDEDLLDFDLGLVGSDTDERKEAFRPVLKSITKEEFNKLSLYEQQRLYDFDPESVEKLLEKDKSLTEILHEEPKRKFSPDLTVEEFRKMSLRDLSDLYNSDPDLYTSLVEESRSGGKYE